MQSTKECFTYHVVQHSLFGLGLGVLLATLIPGLQNIWIGIVVMVVAVLLDMMRGGKKPTSAAPGTPTM